MNKRTRRRLFYLSIVVFIFLSIGVLSFAFGISYDLENNKIIKTGSINLSTNVDAQILIDGEAVGNTSLLGNSYSKRNLLPGSYQVEVKREGFLSWEKQVEVRAGLVTDFARILLVTQEPETEKLGSASILFFSQGDRWMATVGDRQLQIWDLFNQEVAYQISLAGLNVEKIKLSWDLQDNRLLVYDGAVVLLADILNKERVNIKNIPSYFLGEHLALSGSKVYNLHFQKQYQYLESFDFTTAKIELVIEDLDSFYLFGDALFFVSSTDRQPHLLHLTDDRLENFPPLPEVFSGAISKVEDAHDYLYFLLGDRLYSSRADRTVLIAEGVKQFTISSDRYLLAWITNQEVWTMGLKDNLYQPQRLTGERELLVNIPELQSMAWHQDSAYLFLETTTKSFLVETDSRGGVNQSPLSELSPDSIWRYNQNLNKIVEVKDGKMGLWSY